MQDTTIATCPAGYVMENRDSTKNVKIGSIPPGEGPPRSSCKEGCGYGRVVHYELQVGATIIIILSLNTRVPIAYF